MTPRDQYLEKLKKEREAADKARIQQNRYNNSKQVVYNEISNRLKEYDVEVRKYGDIYNSTFFDESGKSKKGYLGNVGEQGKAATFQAANIVTKRRAVQDAVAKWSDYLDDDYKASIEKYFNDSNAELTKLNKDFQDSYNYYSRFKDEADYKTQLAEAEKYKNEEGASNKIAALEAEKAEIDEWLKNPKYMPLSDSELKQETTPEAKERAIRQSQDRVYNGYKLASEELGQQINELMNKHFPSEKRTWFKAGAFEDGYQFGDVSKTVKATNDEIKADLIGGILDIGEGAVDTGAYILGGLGRLAGSHWFQDQMQKFIKKDLYSGADIVNKAYGTDKESSILGDKTDSLIQSGGQLLGTAAIEYLTKGLVPWWVTTGTSSFGSQAETALNDGANYGQAGASGLISAGAEILSEKLSGGISFGGSTLDDIVLDPLLDKISKKTVKALAKTGINAAGEGFEEIFSGVVSNLGTALYKEESLDEILLSEEALDEYVESFVGGAFLGGAMGVVRNAGEVIADSKNTAEMGKTILSTPSAVDELVVLGRSLPDTAKLADKVSTNPTAYNVGMLYSAVEKAITPNKEEWGQRLAETEKDVYNAVSASSVVSEAAARRINGSFASSINTTPLPEDIKALVAESFFLPSDIDPNSYAAVEYARDFAEDAATAFEAGQKQIETKQTLDIEKLQEITSVATPEQLEYFMTLGKESVLSKKTYKTSAAEQPQTVTEKKNTAPEGVRKAALAKRLAPANEDLIKATKADTSLNKTQKMAAEIGEKLGVAVIYDDTTKYYTSKRDGAFFKNRNVVLIDKNTINPVKQVFVHEITHFSEKSKYYAALSEKVFRSKALDKWLSDKGYTEKTLIGKISSYRNAKKSVYEQAGENLTKEGADAELIANFLADTVGTEEKFDSFMSELTSEEKKTFLDWLKEIITRIYDAFSGSIPSELREIEKLYKKALTEAGEGVKNRKNSRTAPDISFSISGGIDSYTEKQYNTFGWATYNGYITAKEREQAFSNFADYKKRRYKFKETDRGEVIFPVGDSETTIVFIDKNSSMSYPNITRVIKINTGLDFYNQEILEELFKYYGSKYKTLSNQAISNYIRQEFFIQHTRRDGSSFVEYSKRQKDEQGNQTSNSSPREQQDGRRGNRSSEETGRTSESGTITEGVQHSIPENGLTPRVEEKGGSIPERTRRLEQRFADGEIDFEELVKGEAELMNEAREKYGVIEEGENAEVEANVPTAVENNKVNSKYVRTILETGAVSDALARQLGAKTLLGDFSHTPISDKEAIAEANEAIKQNTAENKWGKTVESIHSVPSKYDLAIGEQLLANALKEGKTTKAIEIASDLVDVYTRAGQALQSARLLKKLTGVGRLVQMQRAVNQINKDIKKRSKKHPEIEISGSLAEELANAKTPEDVDSIAKDIETDIASQMKVTWLDTLNAWRYLCMLANPITHVRNFVGNMIFVPSVQARRALQYVMEKALPAEQRTIAYKIDDKYKEFAEKAVNDTTVRSVLDGTDKYSAKTKAMMKRKVLPRPIQAIYEKNSELLGGEDMWYKTRYYKNALASYLQARQIDLDKITETEIAKASQYAITEAMKNTYADESALARWLNLAKSLGFGGYLAVESLIPFRKTPINIIKRGIEYSPIGLVSALTIGTAKLKNGKITASEYIYGLSAGGSGTIAFVMGMFLAAIGAASGGFDDDDESKYRKLLGEQEYALIIDGKSYTIDWAAPINIPFFMGVELMKQLESQNGEVRFADAVAKSTFAMLDPIINLSMLSGLQRAFQSLRYGEDAASFGAVAGSAVASYASQFIPAVGGKVTSFVSEDRKANYIDKNSQLPSFVQSILNSMMAKSIFFDDRNPYIDAWGRTVSQGNVGERFLENFVSPGYFNKTDYTIVDVALMELYEETGEMGILPDAAGKYFAVDGVRKDLTADEYTEYAKAKGQYSFTLIKEFFDSDISKELTAEEKVKTIKKIYEYATDKAKAVVSDYNVEKNNKTAYGEEKAGRSVAQYFAETVEAEKYAPKLFNQALENGNTEEIIQLKKDILSYKKENGDTAKEALQSLRQSVTSYWKPKYIDAWVAQDSAEMKRITKALAASGLYDNVRTTKEEWYKEYQKEQRKSK